MTRLSSDSSEFQAIVEGQLKQMEEDNTPDSAFKRLMLTHTLHASRRGEILKEKLASIELHDQRQDEELANLSKTLCEFKTGQIKDLDNRLSTVERKLLISYGVLIAVIAVPNIPTIYKFIAGGSAAIP